MSSERKPGYYWAKHKVSNDRFPVYYNGESISIGVAKFKESEFISISPQTIEDEILGLKYKADTLSDMLTENEKQMKIMEEELKRLKDENRWISVEDRPLFNKVDEDRFELTDDGSGEFLAMIPFVQRGQSGEEYDSILVRHCVIVHGVLHIVADDDTIPSGWELTDVTHWRPLPSTQITTPSETATDLLNSEVNKANITISRLLKLKDKIEDLTLDDIGRELGKIIGDAVKNDSITKA